MGEIRKPSYKMLLEKTGNDGAVKKHKIEVYTADLWPEIYNRAGRRGIGTTMSYRMRIDGKWFPKGKIVFFKKTAIKNMVWKAIRLSDTHRA